MIVEGLLALIGLGVLSSITKDEKKKEDYKQVASEFWNDGGHGTMRIAESIDQYAQHRKHLKNYEHKITSNQKQD